MSDETAAKMRLNDVEILHSVFQSLAIGVVVCDENGRFLYFNEEAERILGLGLLDIAESEWAATYGCYQADGITLYPRESLPLIRALAGEEVVDELMLIRNAHLETAVWISISGRPFRDDADRIRGGSIVFRDVTEAQETLQTAVAAGDGNLRRMPRPTGFECRQFVEHIERLRGHYDRLCRAVEQTADAVLITDSRGVIEYVNPAFEETTGYRASETLGRTPRMLKSGKHGPEFYRDLWEHLLAGKTFRGAIVNRKKSGELYWAEQTITPIKDETGRTTHFVSVLNDVTELRKQQEQELHLQFAREVQQRFYSAQTLLPGFDLAGGAYPAASTGGDYFDFIPQPDGGLLIVIADVSGHGFGSALVMAETRAYVRAYAQVETGLGRLLSRVNQSLQEDLGDGKFVTLLLARVDPGKRRVEYAGAGHVPGYLLDRKGQVRSVLESLGPPLGLFPCPKFCTAPPLEFNAGDVLVLLTDGVLEAENLKALEFGAERALDYIRRHSEDTARDLVHGIYEATRAFSRGEPQHDDILSVVCKMTGGQEG